MKNNIEYYPHFTKSDEHGKFKALRTRFGWAGEGRFWALNNRIGLAENCVLDLTKGYNKSSLASDLNLNISQLDEFLEYLHNSCHLIYYPKEGCVTTEIVQETLKRVMKEREDNRLRLARFRDRVDNSTKGKSNALQEEKNALQDTSNALHAQSNGVTNPQTKAKESKEKETVLRTPSGPPREIFDSEQLLKPSSEEYVLFVKSIQELLYAENEYRPSNPFHWPPETFNDDIRSLVYQISDETKKKILLSAYNANGQKMNWLSYVRMAILITSRASLKQRIIKPVAFCYALLQKPLEIASQKQDGLLSSSISTQVKKLAAI